MVIIAVIVLLALVLTLAFVVGLVVAAVSLIRGLVHAIRPTRTGTTDLTGDDGCRAARVDDDVTDVAFNEIITREWPTT